MSLLVHGRKHQPFSSIHGYWVFGSVLSSCCPQTKLGPDFSLYQAVRLSYHALDPSVSTGIYIPFQPSSTYVPCARDTMDNEKYIHETQSPDSAPEEYTRKQSIHTAPLDATPKSRWERSWPTIACGSGLFSDGYLNGYVVSPFAARV